MIFETVFDIKSEYGLAFSADSCERRIFEAAIKDIARVILDVFSTLLILRLICLTLGINYFLKMKR